MTFKRNRWCLKRGTSILRQTYVICSTCSVLHARQNSNIYTLVQHRVTTEFVIWLRKWCTVSNEGGTIKVPVYTPNTQQHKI
jgi:hypothetical protein